MRLGIEGTWSECKCQVDGIDVISSRGLWVVHVRLLGLVVCFSMSLLLLLFVFIIIIDSFYGVLGIRF